MEWKKLFLLFVFAIIFVLFSTSNCKTCEEDVAEVFDIRGSWDLYHQGYLYGTISFSGSIDSGQVVNPWGFYGWYHVQDSFVRFEMWYISPLDTFIYVYSGSFSSATQMSGTHDFFDNEMCSDGCPGRPWTASKN